MLFRSSSKVNKLVLLRRELHPTFNLNPLLLYNYYYYYYYILRLLAKLYEKLLAIRLRKPFMNKNPRCSFFAPFLCSFLLVYSS
jgi:hypothetical protein